MEAIHRCKAKVRLAAGDKKVIQIHICFLHSLEESEEAELSEVSHPKRI
jgi:hypothetical protein